MIVLTEARIFELADRANKDRILVKPVGPNAYVATSAKTGAWEYNVSLVFQGARVGVTCTCKAGQNGIACKHAGLAADEEMIERGHFAAVIGEIADRVGG